jgi:hypothetical protein
MSESSLSNIFDLIGEKLKIVLTFLANYVKIIIG